MKTPARFKIVLALAAVYIIWGSTYYAIKVLVNAVPPFFVSGARFILAGLILFGWELFRGVPIPKTRQWFNSGVTAVTMIVFGYGSVAWTSQYTPSAIIAILVSAVPIWMTVFSLFNPNYAYPKLSVYAGLIIGLIGVAVMVNPFDLGGQGSIKLEYAAMILLGTLAWSLGSLYSARVQRQQSVLMSIALQMTIGGFALVLVGTLSGELNSLRLEAFTPEAWIALLYLIIFGSLVAFSAYIWLLYNIAPSLAGTYAFVNPLVALLIGTVIAGEVLTARELLAAIVILVGVVLITLGQERTKKLNNETITVVKTERGIEKTAEAELCTRS